jgi:hypothetical protein
VLSPLQNFDITGPGLNWDFADGFQRQCDSLRAALVWDYPEHVMTVKVSYASCPMGIIAKGAPMVHSTFRPLENARDEYVYLDLLDKTHIHVLDSLGVHAIHNQF